MTRGGAGLVATWCLTGAVVGRRRLADDVG